MNNYILIELSIYSLILVGLLAVCDNEFSKKYYVPLKGVCSASFLVLLIIETVYSEKFGQLIVPLLACFVGDIMLGMYNTYAKKRFMAIGMGAFMLAHVGFILYMAGITGDTIIWVYLLPFAACGLMYYLCKRLHLHMGKLLIPGLVYAYFVTTMFAKSLTAGSLAYGGLLFFLSDFSILFLYFFHFKKKTHKMWVHYFNLLTYYYAIIMFIWLPF